LALLLTLPLIACEPDSIMDRSAAAPEDAGDQITNQLEDSSEETEETTE